MILAVITFVTIKPKANQINQTLPLSAKLKHMDAVGTVLFVAGMCCLLLVLQLGGQKIAWKSSKAIGLLIGFGVIIGAFCALQLKRGEYATIPPRVLKKRSIYMGALILFFLGMSSMTASISTFTKLFLLSVINFGSMHIIFRYTSSPFKEYPLLRVVFGLSASSVRRSLAWLSLAQSCRHGVTT